MRTRSFAALVAALAAPVAACASSDVDVPAADPSQIGPAPSAGSGVLRPGFDPAVLAPPAPAGGGHDHHHHHHGAPADPHSGHGAPADPHAGHGPPADPHAGHRAPAPLAPSAPPSSMPPDHHHAAPPPATEQP